jgi:hypothetical protein
LVAAAEIAASDAEQLIGKHHCDLEYWLKSEGERLYGTYIEFRKLLAKHQEFYGIVEIIAHVAARRANVTFHHELISTPQFARASIDIAMAVNELKATVERTQKINSQM